MSLRPPGPAGEEPSYDYQAAYATAGVAYRDGTIDYRPGGEIAEQITNGSYAYVGLTFEGPEWAESVTLTTNGMAQGPFDLTSDSEDVIDGKLAVYFPFATKTGSALKPKTWRLTFSWRGKGRTAKTRARVERA